ncbi:hypothetical protein Cni_G26049 [Canna indica]|uniref:Zinc finger PMZ-type domain-containing protein n=1 Tax=Canna indica TaxID=4628 RepID=A0AAQ3KZ49_9LILI|nr:hypothetical protein Cni_G26049 [Canna indica]
MEESKLNKVLTELATTLQQAHDSLITTGLKFFCQTHVSTVFKFDNVTNNISETFNVYIIKARSKPIVDMLEEIRRMLMQRMNMKREMVSKWFGDICPNIRRKLEKSKEESRYCIVTPSGNFKFEVQYMDKIHVINLGNQTYTCRRWDLSGIPCNHAVSCINRMKEDPEKYISDYFKRDVYLKTYEFSLEPLTEKDTWPAVEGPHILPPDVKKIPGRPKEVRRRELHEDDSNTSRYSKHGSIIKCQIYFLEGHNISCPLRTQGASTHVEEMSGSGLPICSPREEWSGLIIRERDRRVRALQEDLDVTQASQNSPNVR